MYTREEQQQLNRQFIQRLLVTLVPAVLVLIAAIVVFVVGHYRRDFNAWKITAALTVVAGAYAIFLYGVYLKPMHDYRSHVNYMLDGRRHDTTGYLIGFAENISERNGVDCHALMINVGEKDDREDDRLFYYDAAKPAPDFPLGTKVVVTSNDMMVAELRKA